MNLNTTTSQEEDYVSFIKEKIHYYKESIQKTLKSLSYYKQLKIVSVQEYTSNIKILKTIFQSLQEIVVQKQKKDEIISELQNINDQLFMIFKTCGSWNIMDILYVCFGNDLIEKLQHKNEAKLQFITQYVHPYQFKIFKQNKQKNNSTDTSKSELHIDDLQISQHGKVLQCFEIKKTSNFYTNIHGIRICFRDNKKNSIIIYGIVEDLMTDCLDNNLISNKQKQFKDKYISDEENRQELYKNFLSTLTLKDVLLYESKDVIVKWNLYIHRVQLLKQKTISQIVKEFINSSLNDQRNMIIDLLVDGKDIEFQYLSYLLYDLLSNDSNMIIDTKEQILLFDNLPWNIREKFKNAMRNTIEYTNTLSNVDTANIPLEQQICLMKADKSIKERAMMKLKEVKSKSEDSGSKARQYLEGLLKIPFGIYRKEECLKIIPACREKYKEIVMEMESFTTDISFELPSRENISNLTIMNYIHHNMKDFFSTLEYTLYTSIEQTIIQCSNKKDLRQYIKTINEWITKYSLQYDSIKISKQSLPDLQKMLLFILKDIMKNNTSLKDQLLTFHANFQAFDTIKKNHEFISSEWIQLNDHIQNNRDTLDKAIYGHKRAKRQIERVIGQWMNGEQSGYCFGFEGPPGIGKTSIAKKGLASCLKDENGVSRPFSFIAIGGTSNGSLLDGHNYTYVGSTWGRIVDILMQSKCMNPIIFIDELDKVSRTEQGKEIIGILTHLVDPTQNDDFQDKYFNGISINLSKALFIFSYNDPDAIDKILLDRIHRVQFDNLSLHDKLVIVERYILPELLESFGLSVDTVIFTKDIMTYIIDHYTYESGVRKLKEVLFEIISEMNLQLFHKNTYIELPVKPTIDDIKHKYLKERTPIKHIKICKENQIGRLNGLWANALGMGGIICIEAQYFLSKNNLELKLTGMQGDVMKESMNVARTLALQLTPQTTLDEIGDKYGIHIHCPDGATPKDGPSAGTAITTLLYSLLNKKKVKRDIAITGEINLSGHVTAIGGLKYKILGGMKAGVKHFLYPQENEDDFKKFYNEYKLLVEGISFHAVSTIQEVFPLVFDEEETSSNN